MEGKHLPATELQDLINEARQLVQALNAPGNASVASSIQERLQVLQKSGAGWVIADGLLVSEDPNARFFGALTLTIKIHQDWDHLGEDKARALLIRLVDYFLLLVNREEAPVVMRKFVTSIAAFFFKPGAPWTHCVRHVAVSMANGKYVPEAQCQQHSFEALVLPSLSYQRILAVLSFSTILAEEALRYPLNGNEIHGRLEANLRDAFFLIEFAFQGAACNNQRAANISSEQPSHSAVEAIKSLHAWLVAVRVGQLKLPDLSAVVMSPLTHCIRSLATPGLALVSMELLVETLNNQPNLLGRDHMASILEFLTSKHGEQYALALLRGVYEDDTMCFLDLLLRYATTEQLDILSDPLQEQNQSILFLLHTMFRGPGFAEVDDKASSLLLGYWTEAADSVNDAVMGGADGSMFLGTKGDFSQVITECYEKLRYPDLSVLSDWDEDDVKNFNGFRRDFTDFLLATYPLLGIEIIQQLQERAVSAMSNQLWDDFEVSIFCLAYLADSVAENPLVDGLLHNLFTSDMFDNLCYNQIEIPAKSRQTLSDMIARYTAYFERNYSLLPRVLNFLFNSLETTLCDQAASKSISALCQSCRRALPAYVNEFISQYDQLRSNPSVSMVTLERVLEGIAAVIQAATSDTEKAAYLMKLLAPLHQQAEQARQEALRGQYDNGLAKGLAVMRCTASIGRGFRAPDEIVINVDVEEISPSAKTFWNSEDAGGAPQAHIIQILGILMSEFSADGDMIEAACDVLKAGYTENTPGPYILPPQVTLRFVKASKAASPRFPTIMGTASAFLASHSSHVSEIKDEAVGLIMHVFEIMCFMNLFPQQYDPEVAHSCIDFLNRLLPKYSMAFFSLADALPGRPPAIPAILNFTLAVLKGPDPLPLRSAAAFWATLLTLPSPPADFIPDSGSNDPTTTPCQPRPFDSYLSSLGDIVMRQVAGRCARSDLDHLSEVIRKFIFRHQGAARLHFGNALEAMGVIPSEHSVIEDSHPPKAAAAQPPSPISSADRERFLAAVLALRGARSTNRVVRDFWLLCRGKEFAYAR